MKKVSKPVAIVMTFILALGIFAVNAFAANKVYAHPDGVFEVEGGQTEETATSVAIGEMVYSTVKADGKAIYKIDSQKKQTLTISYKSATPVNITVATEGAENPACHVKDQIDFSTNIEIDDAYYYITFENYVAPVAPPVDGEGTENEGAENEGTENEGTENEGTENGGENTQPASQNEEAVENPFFFTTSVTDMEAKVKVNVNYSEAKIVAGESLQLKLDNFNVTNLNYCWEVLDDESTKLVDERDIVTVSRNGLVTVKPNSATFKNDTKVTVQAVMYYNGKSWEKPVTITAVPANVFLSPYFDTTEDNCLTIGEGASRYITATTNLKDATVTWSTENPEIASVTVGGKVTGVGVGKTYIKASVKIGENTNGEPINVSRRVLVDVKLNHVSVMGISFDTHSDTVRVNDYKTLNYTFETAPADKNPSNAKVTFTSSDTKVATVDADGKVTGVAVGTATITVTSDDGKYTDTCTVTVQEAIPNWLMVIIAPLRMIYNLIMMILGR